MIAYGALLLWPVVALALYMTMPAGRATIWTILGGYLVLPIVVSFDFAGIPSMDKSTIPNVCALLLAPIMARAGEFRWPRSVTVNLLLLVFVFSQFGTAFANGDPIRIGSFDLPGLGFREGLSAAIGAVLQVVPFVLGAALLAGDRAHRQILVILVFAAFIYSIPILAEVRLSPFLQARIYEVSQAGYFIQQIRGGGFRAMVFLGHGLLVSTFIAMALLSAIGLTRMRARMFGLPMAAIAGYLALVLLLNKSLGAAVFAIAFGLPLIFLPQRRFLSLMFGIALLILVYPAVRAADVLPLTSVTETVAMVSQDRAESLDFRFRNEDMLLAHARERPLFGWGSYGRNRVIAVTSYGATKDVSVTDGTWVITLGMSGWVGYLALFGLLTYPFWRAFRLRRAGLSMATVTLLAAHLLNLFDLIPNASLRPITWLVAGALAGMTAARRASAPPASPTRAGRQPAVVPVPALQE
ncbi:hypothetical protein [Sphingobium nicotianae]|uniref:O-antigen ligase domain-containing protein n=1 Tax=Sphingobium nicotianae TaxID=2782607 RepID=A0A9X1ISV5_9SPHN|nr:hypothetical protein [Sphingobium nicotianae]MBT2188956.1 hypothetical protein [Sphingobium nicotianae]